MTTRYVYIQQNKLIWGPGPNPYFLTLTNGDIWEISAHTVEESEAIGIYEVEQLNKRDFDERIEQAETPIFSMINGRPVETWIYSFIPAARENMLLAVDEHAEKIRSIVATQFSGQYQEYDEVYKEALEVLNLPVDATISEGTYKLLEADINVTFSNSLNRYVQNVREAGELVAETRTKWLEKCSEIRKSRLLAKKNIKNSETDDEAYEFYTQYVTENS